MKKHTPKGIQPATLKRLLAYGDYFKEAFGRSEQRHWSTKYLMGLMMEGERKSVEPIAQRVPGGNVQAMQQFIGQSPWDWEEVQEKYRERLFHRLGKKEGVLVVDDTGFLKKGDHSVGVAKQYYGMTKQPENCQSAVSCYYAKGVVGFPTGIELYLPQEWCVDWDRREKAGIPLKRRFRTKWKMALELIDQALESDVQPEVVVGDCGYGQSVEFRMGLEERQLAYVVSIRAETVLWKAGTVSKIIPPPKRHFGRPRKGYVMNEKPQSLSHFIDEQEWKMIRWRKGTKGWLFGEFQRKRVEWVPKDKRVNGLVYQDPKEYWLLMERTPLDEIKYYLCDVPEQTPLRKLIQLAHTRWVIELSYQQMKGELGLDHFEGRGWVGWHHHVTMVMLAYGFLVEERLCRKKKSLFQPSPLYAVS